MRPTIIPRIPTSAAALMSLSDKSPTPLAPLSFSGAKPLRTHPNLELAETSWASPDSARWAGHREVDLTEKNGIEHTIGQYRECGHAFRT